MRKKYTIMTDQYEYCLETGRPATDWHHCHYGRNRQHADEDGLVIPMDHEAHMELHRNSTLSDKWKRIAQARYLESHCIDEWMKRYGKNYL